MQVPLATGESLFGRFEFLNLISARGADIIQPDVCICGGLLALRKIAAIAEAPIDLDGDYRLEDVQTGSYRVYAKERSSDTSASFDLDGDGSSSFRWRRR